MLDFLRKLYGFLRIDRRGTDVVELNDTSATDLDYAIPELNKMGSRRGNSMKNKIFSKKHGTSVRTIRGKAK